MMGYTEEIFEKLKIVNEVLAEIRVPSLLENPDFFVDEMSMESWLKINLKDNEQNKIPLSLILTLTSLEVRLDRISEAIDWSNENLKESNGIVKSMLINLFTSYILVERYGSTRTQIRLFSQDGKCTNDFKYTESFFLKGSERIDFTCLFILYRGHPSCP